MNKPLYTVNIERLSHECRGIGHIGEKTAFVLGALPGETVECQVIQKHRNYLDACFSSLITTASPDRITAKCPHFLVCGGCSVQHIKPEAQIRFKQALLLEQLSHSGKAIPQTILDPVTGPAFGYRHKARLGVRYVNKKEKILVGFRETQGRYLAEINHCDILHPSIGYKLHELAELIAQLSIPRDIAQIEVAMGDTEIALIFRHLAPLNENDLALLSTFGETYHFHIYLQPNKPGACSKLYPADGHERLHYALPEYDLNFAFHPTDFTQINPTINRKMVSLALQLLNPAPHDKVLDLFCGLGNFTLSLARKAGHVIGVEGCEKMVARAKENALLNHIHNVHFYAHDLMADKTDAPWIHDHYSQLLIDPPRSGARDIIQKIGPLKIPKIVYISCNPATLARDTEILTQHFGYTLKAAGILDMFPQTAHVESIALFER